jgi:diadenosine tetraphosphatase ApaH/serine/threonine PP2A family protein phosphatase
MRYAFYSDVHGNLEALKAVIRALSLEKVDRKIFLGDVVGYYPDPNKCVKLVKKYSDIQIMGNHDYAVLGHVDLDSFNIYAREAIEWTQENLWRKWARYIATFPLSLEIDGFLLVHANPMSPDRWNYVLTVEDAEKNFQHFDQRICFIAHSHRPVFIVKSEDDPPEFVGGSSLNIADDCRYIINIGSVGQPRDLIPDACYLVYDSDANYAYFRRVPYRIGKTQKKTLKAGLPEFLSGRLAMGR